MVFLLLGLAARAGALVGVDWVPLGRGDLAWVEEGELSGTLVAEGDGLLSGALRPWGGWAGQRFAVLGGLSGAALSTRVTSGTSESYQSVAAVRPSLEGRYYLLLRERTRPLPWVCAGGYGVIPTARDWSELYTPDEQEAVDEESSATRARIGAWGIRAGGGAEVWWQSGLVLGARASAILHRAAYREDEDTVSRSTLFATEAALELGFGW